MSEQKTSFVTKYHLGRLAVNFETYVFSISFLCSAINSLVIVLKSTGMTMNVLSIIFQGKANIHHYFTVNNYIFNFLLIFFNLIIVSGLFSRKNIKQYPDNLREIIVPFIATFNLLSFNLVSFLPAKGNIMLIPHALVPAVSVIGTLLSTAGIAISILAIVKLRTSFGIFVQVRSIICTGVYKYVRHPIYLGYFLDFIGYSLLQGKLYYFLLTGLSMVIFVYRSKLEENKLAQHSEEYRAYMAKTPGIWPRLKLNRF